MTLRKTELFSPLNPDNSLRFASVEILLEDEDEDHPLTEIRSLIRSLLGGTVPRLS